MRIIARNPLLEILIKYWIKKKNISNPIKILIYVLFKLNTL